MIGNITLVIFKNVHLDFSTDLCLIPYDHDYFYSRSCKGYGSRPDSAEILATFISSCQLQIN